MLQPHLKIEGICRNVLLPGDPNRIDRIISFMTDVREVKTGRGFRMATGRYGGVEVAAVSSGMGCPSAAIVVEELAGAGAKNIIRVGTCGGLLAGEEAGDLVIPTAAACLDGTTKEYKPGIKTVKPDGRLVRALIDSAGGLGSRYFTGTNRTHDAFYEPAVNFLKLAGKGFVSSEMECSAVFLIGRLRRIRTAAVLVVVTPEAPEAVRRDPMLPYRLVDRERVRRGMDNGIKSALEALAALGK
jgi:uridine phosphorylase